MKYLGIDYGSKRIGIALSDDGGNLAFPKQIIKNTNTAVEEIVAIVKKESVDTIVIGRSVSSDGKSNAIQEDITGFEFLLRTFLDIPIVSISEAFTSHAAGALKSPKLSLTTKFDRQKKESGKELDASAAALILQRFLDGQKK